jgi:hypothetical protein
MDANANLLEKPADLGKTPEAVARRWKLELKLADKREADWRKAAKAIYDIYTPPNPVANTFNIFWTNTETLQQSVYNSLPQPDVRRRYQDEDPLGKQVGEVLTRALEYVQDTYDFDDILKDDVLCALIAGRGLSRVRYIPDIQSHPGNKRGAPEYDENAEELEPYDEVTGEQVCCENVQWQDFRILCNAKNWNQVTAIGFRHRFTRDDCIDKFGEEIGNAIPLDASDDEEVKKSDEIADLFKTAEIWEIWDKDNKEVIFICPGYPKPCKTQEDPMELRDFWPVPRPLYAIKNNQSLVPAALYTQYEQQAKELNRISMRINKLIDALRVRGIYDSTLNELSSLMKAADNELIPAEQAAALIERGGLDKAIWMMPIDMAANVLKVLYEQRDATKQVIYEITGISDIMRAASDPNETFGAQKIKTQWGTQRLQRLQKEVQRYIRDLIRLKAEIISSKFQMHTLEQMTLIQMPHQAEVDMQMQQMQMQYAQAVAQAQQAGQPAPPQPQMPPPPVTWEAVMQEMKNDATRTYRVDIETDSTLSATQDSDMAGLKEVLTACVQLLQGFGPAVQQGAMDVSILKEMMLAVVRRAKMGTAVEDAIEKMKQPPAPPDPNAGKVQAQQQIEQAKLAASAQQNQQALAFEKEKAQLQAQIQAHAQQVQADQNQQQQQMEAQRAQMEQANNAALEQIRIQSEERVAAAEQQLKLILARLDNATKIEVAEISAGTALQTAQMSAATAGAGSE